MTQAAEITIRFMNMKKQQGSYNCGIYAIAYATALVYGQDPASYQSKQEKMRPHLKSCFWRESYNCFCTKPFLLQVALGPEKKYQFPVCVECQK